MALDASAALEEFNLLKTENQSRNVGYYMLRQAVQGNFRWPRDWPNHIPKVKHNYCKPITERFSTFLMGKNFTYSVERPNTLEFRDQAERSEKILRKLVKLSNGEIQFMEGARTGSVLGRTVFKVYKTGKPGREHACFQHVQPDYFYGIYANDSPHGEYAKVFYSYPLDRSEAVRMFGPGAYQSEQALAGANRYDNIPEESATLGSQMRLARRIPVMEVWTKEDYLLIVGGVTIFNGDNPFKWTDTEEGFIPFVVVENIRNEGTASGESDIAQIRDLNEQLNYLLSRKQYVVGRWLHPTLVWEGAPQNYLEVLTATIGGGGAIPTRLGSRLYFLAYDHANPAVDEMEQGLRKAMLETVGLNEIAFQGTVHGYVNSGTSVNAQYQPTTSLIQKKQQFWEVGLQRLFGMLLEIQEGIGDSEALGLAVINASVNSKDGSDGEVVQLSGHDIAGLRSVKVSWPGLLPKDDQNAAAFELQKAQAGLQSFYTTLEKLGAEYPDDEIQRIRQENTDPSLKGQQVAEQLRAQGSNAQAMANAQATMQGAQGPGQPDPNAPQQAPPPGGNPEADMLAQGNIGARLRELARNAQPQLNQQGDEPVIGGPAAPGGR